MRIISERNLPQSNVHIFGGLFTAYRKCVSRVTIDPLPSNSRLVRVRTWKSGYTDESGVYCTTTVGHAMAGSVSGLKQANVGHVSVETKDFYASLWPTLEAGGIARFVKKSLLIPKYVVATPNNIADLVLDAQRFQKNQKETIRKGGLTK